MPAVLEDARRGEAGVSHAINSHGGRLAIFPNATDMIPFDDPATFNGTVERFLWRDALSES